MGLSLRSTYSRARDLANLSTSISGNERVHVSDDSVKLERKRYAKFKISVSFNFVFVPLSICDLKEHFFRSERKISL